MFASFWLALRVEFDGRSIELMGLCPPAVRECIELVWERDGVSAERELLRQFHAVVSFADSVGGFDVVDRVMFLPVGDGPLAVLVPVLACGGCPECVDAGVRRYDEALVKRLERKFPRKPGVVLCSRWPLAEAVL